MDIKLVIRASPGSGKRQRAVSGNALHHSAIRAGPVNGERKNGLDHLSIRACSGWSREQESSQEESTFSPKTSSTSSSEAGAAD